MTLLARAASSGKLDVVKFLIEKKGADFIAVALTGITPLSLAAYYSKWDVVKYLIEQGAEVNAADKYGRTVLHRAASYGQLDVVKFLIEQGANINSLTHDQKEKLLKYVKQHNHQNIIDLLSSQKLLI